MNFTDALIDLEEYRAKADADDDVVLEKIMETANLAYLSGKLKKALELLKDGIYISGKQGEIDSVAECYGEMGTIHLYKSNFNEALHNFKLSIDQFKSINDYQGHAIQLTNIALVHLEQGNAEKALELCTNALQLAENKELQIAKTKALTNRGKAHFHLGDFDDALRDLTLAVEIAEAENETLLSSVIWAQMGMVFRAQNKLDKAIDHYKKAFDANRETGNTFGRAEERLHIGAIHLEKGEITKASSCFEKAMKTFSNLNIPIGQAKALYLLGRVKLQTGDLVAASKLWQQAVDNYKNSEVPERGRQTEQELLQLISGNNI